MFLKVIESYVDVCVVNLEERAQHLSEVVSRPMLWKDPDVIQKIRKVLTICVLHREVNVFFVLKNVVKLHDVSLASSAFRVSTAVR